MALASRPAGQARTLLAMAAQTCCSGEMGVAELVTVLGSLDLSGAGVSGRFLAATSRARASQPWLWLGGMGISTKLDISGHRCRRSTPLVLWDRRAGQTTKIRPAPLFQTQERAVQIWLSDLGQCLLLDDFRCDHSIGSGVLPAMVIRQRIDQHLVV